MKVYQAPDASLRRERPRRYGPPTSHTRRASPAAGGSTRLHRTLTRLQVHVLMGGVPPPWQPCSPIPLRPRSVNPSQIRNDPSQQGKEAEGTKLVFASFLFLYPPSPPVPPHRRGRAPNGAREHGGRGPTSPRLKWGLPSSRVSRAPGGAGSANGPRAAKEISRPAGGVSSLLAFFFVFLMPRST